MYFFIAIGKAMPLAEQRLGTPIMVKLKGKQRLSDVICLKYLKMSDSDAELVVTVSRDGEVD